MQRLINEIVERAKANRQRIVLPEGTEERTLKAANQILTDGVADLIILGKPAEIEACAKEWGLGNINKATIIDPEDHPKKEEYAQLRAPQKERHDHRRGSQVGCRSALSGLPDYKEWRC